MNTDSIFPPFVEMPTPTQKRSQEALLRLLKASESLLAENQFEQAGVAEIAKRAQTSVGTFYRLFEDKETLLMLLLQDFFSTTEVIVNEMLSPTRWQGKGIKAIAKSFTREFVDIYSGRRGVLRAMVLLSSRDAEFRDQVHRLNEHIARLMAALLMERLDKITHPHPELAIPSVMLYVLAPLNMHILAGTLGNIPEAVLAEDLCRVFVRYLGVK